MGKQICLNGVSKSCLHFFFSFPSLPPFFPRVGLEKIPVSLEVGWEHPIILLSATTLADVNFLSFCRTVPLETARVLDNWWQKKAACESHYYKTSTRHKAKNWKGGLDIYVKIEYATTKCTGEFLDPPAIPEVFGVVVPGHSGSIRCHHVQNKKGHRVSWTKENTSLLWGQSNSGIGHPGRL